MILKILSIVLAVVGVLLIDLGITEDFVAAIYSGIMFVLLGAFGIMASS